MEERWLKDVFQRTKPHVERWAPSVTSTTAKLTLWRRSWVRQAHKNNTEGRREDQELCRTSPGGGIDADANKTVTIAGWHVEYETPNRHYAHIDCPERGLHQEHDYRGGPDGRGHTRRGRQHALPDAPNPRARATSSSGRRAPESSSS